MDRCGNLWQLWLSLVVLVSLTACTGSTPAPNIEATVSASISATMEAMPTSMLAPTSPPTPGPSADD